MNDTPKPAPPPPGGYANAGQPTKYNPDYHLPQVYRYCLLGAVDDQIAKWFGIAVSTLNNWKLAHPLFMEAIRAGREEADAKVASALYSRAIGMSVKETKIATHEGRITDSRDVDKHYPPDVGAAKTWLQNRTRTSENPWRFTENLEISGPDGGPVEQVVIDPVEYAKMRKAMIKDDDC